GARGTPADYACEIGVHRAYQLPRAQASQGAPRGPEVLRFEDGTGIGGPPDEGVGIVARPWEYAMAVGVDQQVGVERPPHADRTMRVRHLGWRKITRRPKVE